MRSCRLIPLISSQFTADPLHCAETSAYSGRIELAASLRGAPKRDEAIQIHARSASGLLRFARNDGYIWGIRSSKSKEHRPW
jgi:hypothetical protein